MMRLFRVLLWLYPSGFRAEYGDELTALFVERRRLAVGPLAVWALWIEAVRDVIWHAVPLHLDALSQDLRYALRGMKRAPLFAGTVVVVAALGIGANTAVFTIADMVLVRALPFDAPENLVRIWQSPPGYSQMEVSPPNYRDWRSKATSFEGMAAYNRFLSANLIGSGEPARLEGAAVTAELLPLLGVQPLFGRRFTEEDGRDGAPATLLLSHAAWRRDFGAVPDILGRNLVLDDVAHTVIGVMPPDFRFPNRTAEFWTTLRLNPGDAEDRSNNFLEVLARLRPGVSLEQARAEMQGIMAQLATAYPVENERNTATVNRLQDEVPQQARLLLFALAGASLCILLIACTNLANLMLARATTRGQELAVRSSLGAGRERLVRQLLTESLLLAGMGGALGMALAWLALPMLARLVPESLPVAGTPSLDARVLMFAAMATLLTGIGFGAWPAVRAGGSSVVTRLREGTRSSLGARKSRLRAVLVIVEITSAVVLLIACGLLIRSLLQVRGTNPGFNPDGVITLRTWLPWPRYAITSDRAAFYSRVLTDVRSLPGVSTAAYTSFLPIVMGGGIWPVEREGLPRTRSESATASLRFITPDYFATMGIPLRQGRDVAETDTREQPFVAVISESFAERYWPGQDAIGRTFGFAFAERTVVGVVGDVKVRGLERTSEPQVYLSHLQAPDSGLIGYTLKDLAVRTTGDAIAMVPAIREIIRRADPSLPITQVQSLEDILSTNTSSRRVQLRMIAAFAILAFLLAALGIHGLLSFTTTHRAHEIGVRIALGARRRTILWMILREGALLGVIGVIGGALAGFLAARAMQALLFGIPPGDPLSFTVAIVLALTMTLAGSLPPALRAAGLDPAEVLRKG
jgi:putative ABC transport system permease protein